MDRLFIFDFDDTLANFSMYNTMVLKQPVRILPHFGGPIKGAVEVLEFLEGRRDRLAMLSMNVVLNDELKWRKLGRLGMDRWFNSKNAFFVRHKTPEIIRRICGRRRKDSCYMVGNSLAHDVRPALEAGINAIFIPRPLATRWLPRRLPRSDRFHRFSSLEDIIRHYDDI
jgi:FMN phosphatase YigB (HAD superfamily)